MHREDGPIDPRAPFTRRKFVAGVGAAAATLAAPRGARAASPSGVPIYRIHPAIGIARLGNADTSQYFIGPEVPGYLPGGDAPGTAVPPYKAPDGRVKQQAARFRIFEYADVGGKLTPVREVNLDTPGVLGIRWQAHLANRKASFHGFEGGQGESRPPAPLRNAGVADRASLEVDFGSRQITGASAGPVPFSVGTSANPAAETFPLDAAGQPAIPYLGELRTDASGRLILLGGKGRTAYSTPTPPPMPHWANNDGWFDDASDGPVTAWVTIDDNGTPREIPMDPRGHAWVLCGPPDFAPGVPGSVTAYDLLFDLAVRSIPVPSDSALYDDGGPLEDLRRMQDDYTPGADPELPTFVPRFDEHIGPQLVAAYNLWWIDELVNFKHNSLIDPGLGDPHPKYDTARKKVASYMRAPLDVPAGTGPRTMPKILGDDPYLGQMPDAVRKLTLTRVQFALLQRWAAGAFEPAGGGVPAPAITPHGLDRAALENCVGGAFFPGIEFGWQMRNPNLFVEPFRLAADATSGYLGEEGQPVRAGHFSRQMAVPWQADFNDCRNEGNYAWWPTQRPTAALPNASATKRLEWARPSKSRYAGGNRESTHEDMVANWYKYGFVLEEGDVFVEKERSSSIA